MIIVPYQAEHLLSMQIQMAQRGVAPFITAEYAKSLEGHAISALVDGECLAVGGIAKIWEHRGVAWSIIDVRAGAHFLTIHKACVKLLDEAPFRRIEADVACTFEAGHRWLRMLGFKLEAPRMAAFGVDGSDSALYARVKHG